MAPQAVLHHAPTVSERMKAAAMAPMTVILAPAVGFVTSAMNATRIKIEKDAYLSWDAWRAAAAEFIAALLFLFITMGAVNDTVLGIESHMDAARVLVISLSFGLSITLLVSATAALSGGHINPAVTVSMVLTGNISVVRAAMYVGAQLSGAVVGAALFKGAMPEGRQFVGANGLNEGVSAGSALLMEIILTFVLVFVIFATAVDKRGPSNVAPLAIGFAVTVAHFVAIPFAGTSLNPARSFGASVVAWQWDDHWIFWLGPIVGAVLASMVYKHVFYRADDVKPAEVMNGGQNGNGGEQQVVMQDMQEVDLREHTKHGYSPMM
eukprot:jgi/Chlat1/5356/Chrsp35S05281